VGIALVESSRVERLAARFGERGLSRVFAAGELAHARKAADPLPGLAARLAAKLALQGALGRDRPVALRRIEVTRAASGQPALTWPGDASSTAHLSLSHEGGLAAAIVWLERE
jgi:holo-[acyl-carrier protein] synthase